MAFRDDRPDMRFNDNLNAGGSGAGLEGGGLAAVAEHVSKHLPVSHKGLYHVINGLNSIEHSAFKEVASQIAGYVPSAFWNKFNISGPHTQNRHYHDLINSTSQHGIGKLLSLEATHGGREIFKAARHTLSQFIGNASGIHHAITGKQLTHADLGIGGGLEGGGLEGGSFVSSAGSAVAGSSVGRRVVSRLTSFVGSKLHNVVSGHLNCISKFVAKHVDIPAVLKAIGATALGVVGAKLTGLEEGLLGKRPREEKETSPPAKKPKKRTERMEVDEPVSSTKQNVSFSGVQASTGKTTPRKSGPRG